VAINHPAISRRHCKIERTSKGVFITDLGSTTGIKVNGILRTKDRYPLKTGDEIGLGPITFLVEFDFVQNKEKTFPIRLILGLATLLLLAPVFFQDPKIEADKATSSENPKKNRFKVANREPNKVAENNDLSDFHFKQAIREFTLDNPERALLEIETALRIKPNNQLAQSYQVIIQDKIIDFAKREIKRAIQEMSFGETKSAFIRLQRVKRVLNSRVSTRETRRMMKEVNDQIKEALERGLND
jgi:pSer/pThr/pTyr-binding forkhead associated (FHA) protein